MRSRFGCAVIMEAHTPHGDGKRARPVRPFGASLWRRWPDFGLGLRPSANGRGAERVAEVVQWKARDVRPWPAQLRSGSHLPWVADVDRANGQPQGIQGAAARIEAGLRARRQEGGGAS
jgi:replicative DNA helicase